MTLTSTNFTTPKTGVVIGTSGGGVKVSPSSGMTVAISSGTFFLGGKQVTYAGGTKTISTAHATLGRYDVIGIDSNGTIIVKEGTPAASPSVPIARDDVLLLAVITIAAGDTSIDTADITDVRNIGGVSVDGTTLSISSGGVMSVLAAGITGFPAVLASGSGTTSLTGNGSAQTVFSDTFTAPSSGDTLILICKFNYTRTAGAGNATPSLTLGGTSLYSTALADGDYFFFRTTKTANTTGARGYLIVENVNSGVPTGVNAVTVSTNTQSITDLGGTVGLTMNMAGGTNGTFDYDYKVIRYITGV